MGFLERVLSPILGQRSGDFVGPSNGAPGDPFALLFSGLPSSRSRAQILAALRNHPWLQAVTRRRAEAVSGLHWRIYKTKRPTRYYEELFGTRSERATFLNDELKKKGAVELVQSHPVLEILRRPNSMMPGRGHFHVVDSWHTSIGESFQEILRKGGKRPTGLRLHVPTEVFKVPDHRSDHYEVRSTDQPGAIRKIASRDMIWTRYYDLTNPYHGRGVGVAESLSDEIDTDEQMSRTAKARFANHANPETIVAFKQASPQDVERIKADFQKRYRGADAAGQTHFTGGDVDVQKISHTMVESQYVEARKLYRDFFVQVHGLPPEIMGMIENSNRSTIDAAEVIFSRYTTVPAGELIREQLQERLVREFGDDLFLDFPSPVPEDHEANRKVKIALPAAFSVDEVRLAGGEEPEGNSDKMVPPGSPSMPVETTPQDAAPIDPDRVARLIDIVVAVEDRRLGRAAALNLIAATYPEITTERARAMLGIEASEEEHHAAALPN